MSIQTIRKYPSKKVKKESSHELTFIKRIVRPGKLEARERFPDLTVQMVV
ncbi:MAG: hypothetical protein ACYC9S_08090 [Leptospirales bacterium]